MRYHKTGNMVIVLLVVCVNVGMTGFFYGRTYLTIKKITRQNDAKGKLGKEGAIAKKLMIFYFCMLCAWSPACIQTIFNGASLIPAESPTSMTFCAFVSIFAFGDSTSNPYLLFVLLPRCFNCLCPSSCALGVILMFILHRIFHDTSGYGRRYEGSYVKAAPPRKACTPRLNLHLLPARVHHVLTTSLLKRVVWGSRNCYKS